MKNRCARVCVKYLQIILLAGAIPGTMTGQRSGPSSKSADRDVLAISQPGTAENTAKSDPVVLKIGTAQLTQSEMESLFAELPLPSTKGALTPEGRRHLAEMYVRVVLLSQQAATDHMDSSPAMRRRLEMQRAKLLAQAEYDKMRGEVKLDPEEIAKYYADHHLEYETVQVREFLVRKRAKDSENADSGLSAQDAMAKAELIRTRLAAGETPDKVAEDLGGSDVLLIDPRPRTLKRSEMVPVLERASVEAKDNGVAGPVDTPDAVLVLLVLKHGRIEEQDAATEIGNKLRAQKLDAELNDLKNKAGVWMSDDYFKKDHAEPAASQPAPSDAKH